MGFEYGGMEVEDGGNFLEVAAMKDKVIFNVFKFWKRLFFD